jgi:hypothetical protein
VNYYVKSQTIFYGYEINSGAVIYVLIPIGMKNDSVKAIDNKREYLV